MSPWLCFIGTKTTYAAVLPWPPAYADHMTRDVYQAAAIEKKWRNSTYFAVRTDTCKRRNRPRRCHALVEIWRDQRSPVVRLSGKPPRDPGQSSASPVIDKNRLTPGEAKETHPLRHATNHYYIFQKSIKYSKTCTK